MRTAITISLLLCLLLQSCSLYDDRDVCCNANTVRFRYWYLQTDQFRRYISAVLYFLFDGSGRFLREMPPKESNIASVDIGGLKAGSYTLVAVGNLHDCGTLSGYAEEGLDAFRLTMTQTAAFDSACLANGDRLYWGERDFTVVEGDTNYFLGEMANVHCELAVHVEWEDFPPFSSGYSLLLENVGGEMEMNGGNAAAIGVQRFPPVTEYGKRLAEEAQLRGGTLDAELVTLRWTDTGMPRLTVLHDGRPACRTVDIAEVFRAWNITPSRAPVQRYEITLRILPDGSVEVRQGLDASVSDWENGGTIG